MRNKKHKEEPAMRGPGQPRLDPASPLERRSVGLPVSWWREIDRLTEERGIKAAVLVRAAIGLYLKKIRRAEKSIRRKRGR